MPRDIKSNQVKPGNSSPAKLDLVGIANAVVTENLVLCVIGNVGVNLLVRHADNATAADGRGPLYIAKNSAVAAGGILRMSPFMYVPLDTSASSVGAAVYLGVAGAPTLTGAGFRRVIGYVSTVGTVANGGAFQFDGSARAGARIFAFTTEVLSGQTARTLTAAALGGAYGGSVVVATLMETNTTIAIRDAVWSTNDLIITLTGATGADRTVGVMIAVD